METRKVIAPQPPAALPTFSGDGDRNRYQVATPHFDARYFLVAAGTNYSLARLEIGVPNSLSERQVFADIGAADGGADVGYAEGTVTFHCPGASPFILPFDFNPGAVAGSKNVGFHITSGGITNAAQNTLGFDIGAGTARLIVPSWKLKINCSKIQINFTRGVAGVVDCYVVLGCLSQGIER